MSAFGVAFYCLVLMLMLCYAQGDNDGETSTILPEPKQLHSSGD